jgi:hypothetical protein
LTVKNRDEAYDFGLVSKAMKVAHKLRIHDLDLVLSFDVPEQASALPFEKFLLGLSRNRKHQIAARSLRSIPFLGI